MRWAGVWWSWLASRTLFQVLGWGVLSAQVVEILTCALRFGASLQSTRDTRVLIAFTFGYRVHHGYVGLLLLMLAPFARSRGWRNLLLVAAVALLLSDLFHHFVVLWVITGAPQFDFRYPPALPV